MHPHRATLMAVKLLPIVKYVSYSDMHIRIHMIVSALLQLPTSAATQADFLKHLYVLGIGVARERASTGRREDQAVAEAAIRLLCVTLEWDFRPSEMPAAASAASMRQAADVTQVRWRRQ